MRNKILWWSLAFTVPVAAALTAAHRYFAGPVPQLWVAGSDGGIQALRQDDGRATLSIACGMPAGALAIDGQRELIWAVCGRTELRAYTVAGDFKASARIPPFDDAMLALDTRSGHVWLAGGGRLMLFEWNGAALAIRDAEGAVVAMTIDRRRSQPWVATRRFLTVHRPDGAPALAVDTSAVGSLSALDYDLELDEVWLAGARGLARYAADGRAAFTDSRLQRLSFVAHDGAGGAWLASATQLRHIKADGKVTAVLEPFVASGDRIVSLVADRGDASVWAASARSMVRYDVAGNRLRRFDAPAGTRVQSLALPLAPSPPELQLTAAGRARTGMPVLQLRYAAADVDPATLEFTANGQPLEAICETGAGVIRCVPRRAMASGHYEIVAKVATPSGLASEAAALEVEGIDGPSARQAVVE